MKSLRAFFIAVLVVTSQFAPLWAAVATNGVWHYTLLPASQLVDDWPVCGRPTIAGLTTGSRDRILGETG